LRREKEVPEQKWTRVNTSDIKKMSRVERLAAIEALWDSLLGEQAEIESPDWHRDVLEERKEKIESGRAEFISLAKLRASRRS